MRLTIPLLLLACTAAIATPAHAVVVNFEDRSGPSLFASAGPPQTLVYTFGALTATFSGGVVLTAASNLPADESSIYGTASASVVPGAGPGLTNPLVITFNQPVTNFFATLLNGFTSNVMYTVADNAGHSASFNLPPNLSSGESLVGFAATGTMVTITSDTSPTLWDFFIDNVTFNEPLPPSLLPEPASVALFGVGLAGLTWMRRRRSGITRERLSIAVRPA